MLRKILYFYFCFSAITFALRASNLADLLSHLAATQCKALLLELVGAKVEIPDEILRPYQNEAYAYRLREKTIKIYDRFGKEIGYVSIKAARPLARVATLDANANYRGSNCPTEGYFRLQNNSQTVPILDFFFNRTSLSIELTERFMRGEIVIISPEGEQAQLK